MRHQLFQTFDDPLSAESLVELLIQEGVPAFYEEKLEMPGLSQGHCVYVAENMLHRARWVVSQSQFEDSELDYLATGRLPGSDGDSSDGDD